MPSMEPKFHHILIFTGVGKIINEIFTILYTTPLNNFFIIYYTLRIGDDFKKVDIFTVTYIIYNKNNIQTKVRLIPIIDT